MSDLDSVRPPAWASLMPHHYPPVHNISSSWSRRLLLAIGREGKLLSHKPDATKGEGYFHFIPQNGSRRVFIKTLRSKHLKSQLEANRIIEQLADEALPVSPLLDGYPRRIDNEYSLFAYNLIDGRFAHANQDDLAALGRLLGRTHNALSALPWAAQIREQSTQRNEHLAKLRIRALNLINTENPAYKPLSLTSITLSDDNAQALHGDLNIGNILFGKSSGQPALLDLEDANHNWHNPIVDLAMAIERFVLVLEPDDKKAFILGKALIDGYKATHHGPICWSQTASDILCILSARSLSLLLNSSQAINQDEVTKFVQLSQQARSREALLRRLWDFGASE